MQRGVSIGQATWGTGTVGHRGTGTGVRGTRPGYGYGVRVRGTGYGVRARGTGTGYGYGVRVRGAGTGYGVPMRTLEPVPTYPGTRTPHPGTRTPYPYQSHHATNRALLLKFDKFLGWF